MAEPGIGVVIPAYKVAAHLAEVIRRVGPEVTKIIVVDDCCPQGSGQIARDTISDSRVEVIFHSTNKGVGGAMISGYRRALELGIDIIVKVDGDGQMPPELIPQLISPILHEEADYTKGNRFFDPRKLNGMPILRIIGNAGLSFITKISTGYWSLVDPTNGFTAIHSSVLRLLEFDRLNNRYFFESDMLFRIGLARAVVIDMPMNAVYGSERSNLSAFKSFFSFLAFNIINTVKRVVYQYFVRNFSAASLYLLVGMLLLAFGGIMGSLEWAASLRTGEPTPTGTIMISTLSIILGFQLLLSFCAIDIASEPARPIHMRLRRLNYLTNGK